MWRRIQPPAAPTTGGWAAGAQRVRAMIASVRRSRTWLKAAAAPAASEMPNVASTKTSGVNEPGGVSSMPTTAVNTISVITLGLVNCRNIAASATRRCRRVADETADDGALIAAAAAMHRMPFASSLRGEACSSQSARPVRPRIWRRTLPDHPSGGNEEIAVAAKKPASNSMLLLWLSVALSSTEHMVLRLKFDRAGCRNRASNRTVVWRSEKALAQKCHGRHWVGRLQQDA